MSPLRLLIMIHIPLRRELGGARVQLELAQQWQAAGHEIEVFDLPRAFPEQSHSLLSTLLRPAFAQRAREFVRSHGHRFDVIDAHQGNLPFTKAQLNFNGLLVMRSVGLHPWYALFNRHVAAQTRPPWKTRVVNGLLSWRDRHESHNCWRSYQTGDLLNLPNPDEKAYLDHYLQTEHKSYVFPFGLTTERADQLARTSLSPKERRSRPPTVVFIGTWSPRKGSQDWREIILTIRDSFPNTQFLFLGTGVGAVKIHQDLQLTEGIEVVPQYRSEDLPKLLAPATVGAFPSYVEGFGFAVLEKLAAGVPTVAYAAAGPASMIRHFDSDCLVPIGDAMALAQQVCRILTSSGVEYEQLCNQAQTVARQFNWAAIAQDTMQTYQTALAQLQ